MPLVRGFFPRGGLFVLSVEPRGLRLRYCHDISRVQLSDCSVIGSHSVGTDVFRTSAMCHSDRVGGSAAPEHQRDTVISETFMRFANSARLMSRTARSTRILLEMHSHGLLFFTFGMVGLLSLINFVAV